MIYIPISDLSPYFELSHCLVQGSVDVHKAELVEASVERSAAEDNLSLTKRWRRRRTQTFECLNGKPVAHYIYIYIYISSYSYSFLSLSLYTHIYLSIYLSILIYIYIYHIVFYSIMHV